MELFTVFILRCFFTPAQPLAFHPLIKFISACHFFFFLDLELLIYKIVLTCLYSSFQSNILYILQNSIHLSHPLTLCFMTYTSPRLVTSPCLVKAHIFLYLEVYMYIWSIQLHAIRTYWDIFLTCFNLSLFVPHQYGLML